MKKALKISVIVLLILCIYSLVVYGLMKREVCQHIGYTETERTELYNRMSQEVATYQCEIPSKEQIKADVQKLIKPILFIEIEKDIKEQGLTYAQFRLIIIKKGITNEDYCYTLVHEYCHLCNMTQDEALTDFRTVKILWESDVQYMRYICARLVMNKLMLYGGSVYDCTGEMIEYFRNN